MAPSHVKRKDSYDELAPKQQAIVDAKLEHPEWDNVQIADHVDTNRSYVSQVLNSQAHIVREEQGESEPHSRFIDPDDVYRRGDPDDTILIPAQRDDIHRLIHGEVTDSFLSSVIDQLIKETFDD